MAKLSREQSATCEKYFPLVGRYAQHFADRHEIGDVDSVESVMMAKLIDLVQCVEEPDEALIKTAIWNKAKDWLRSENRRDNHEWLTQKPDIDESEPPEEREINEELQRELREHIKYLEGKEKEVVTRYLEGQTFREIGPLVGMTAMGACKAFKRAVRTLRLMFATN